MADFWIRINNISHPTNFFKFHLLAGPVSPKNRPAILGGQRGASGSAAMGLSTRIGARWLPVLRSRGKGLGVGGQLPLSPRSSGGIKGGQTAKYSPPLDIQHRLFYLSFKTITDGLQPRLDCMQAQRQNPIR